MKYFIVTYGCQMNKSDSERIATVLEKIGYQPAPPSKHKKINTYSIEGGADLIVVNMCSIRQSAVNRVYGKIFDFAKLKVKNEKLKIILTGCILKKDLEKFKKHFDFILPIKTLSLWPEVLNPKTKKEKYLYYPSPRDLKFTDKFKTEYLKEKSKYSKNFSALIPISSGCDNFCSFCAVPYARGPLICRPHKEILKEAEFAVEKGLNPIRNTISNGAREIWLLGQNVNDYSSPICANAGANTREYSQKFAPKLAKIRELNFAKLLKMVNEIKGNFWIRFTSPHPKNFSDELIETMAKCQKVTPYLNLPLQSGDDEVLKRMNRPYTAKQYKNLVKKIRTAFKKYRDALPACNTLHSNADREKEISISTDIIVGFPGESKKQFENTLSLFKEIKFDMAYIAKYSPRPGTAAIKLKDDVPAKEKGRRYKILTEILKEIALKKNKKYIGRTVEVLVEAEQRRLRTPKYAENQRQSAFSSASISFYNIGKTRTYKTVKIQSIVKGQGLRVNPGQFVKVKIIDAVPWGLKGKFIKQKVKK